MAKKTETDEKSAATGAEIVEKAIAKPVDELTALKAELAATRASRAELEEKLERSQADVKKLQADFADSYATEESFAEPEGDCVFLDGKRYEILHRNKVKEFFEDIKRRHVAEDITAIAIDLKA